MKERTSPPARGKLLFFLSLFFIAGFLVACVLSFCGILTPAVAGIIGVACLAVFTALNGVSQRTVNPRLCKVDWITAALLAVVLAVLIVLLATGLWA